jgi:hypothetical protein
MNLEFHDWTAKDIESRILEATQTLMLLPKVDGPREYGNSMPETVRERWKDAAPTNTPAKRRVDPGAITRMEECWEWQRSMIDDADRIFIDQWARLKVRKGRRLKEMSGNDEAKAKEINRRKTRVCSVIANALNLNHAVRLTTADLQLSENQSPIALSTVTSPNCDRGANHWIATDAKPHSDPAQPRLRVIDPRAIRKRRKSKAKHRKGKKPTA